MLATAVVGVSLTGTPAFAAADEADVAVEVVIERNIVTASGWSSIQTFVSNDGSVPAAGVTLAVALPEGLRVGGFESTSNWDCDFEQPVTRCTRVGDLAPGVRDRSLVLSVSVEGVSAGAVLETRADVTTSTPESDSADNADTGTIRVVAPGTVRGNLWNDLNADGIRQATEPPAESVGLSIRSLEDYDQYGFSNNYQGTYSESVPAKRYQIFASLSRSSWRFATPDVGDDTTDSDLHQVSQDTYTSYGESSAFTVDPATPTVIDLGVVAAYRPTNIQPKAGKQGTTRTVTLTGEAFSTNLTPQLTRTGADPVVGTVKSISTDRKTMKVAFPLAGVATGKWTLTLASLFGDRAEVADAFTVKPPAQLPR